MWTSQSMYWGAAGRLNSTGFHTPGSRSGVLDLLISREAGFSRSGVSERSGRGFLRAMNFVEMM